MNTGEFLTVTAAVVPDRIAIVFEGHRYSYAEVADRSNRLANALLTLGVHKGDRVSFIDVNSNQCMESYFACAKMGAIYVPLNFRARAEEFAFMLNDSGASVVFVGDRYVPIIDGIRGELKGISTYISLGKPAKGMSNYEDLISKASADEVFTDIDESDLTILMFTAGTTGVPKAVMLAHQNFSDYVTANVTPVDTDVEEKNILTVPMYHIAGIQAVMSAVYGGRTLVIQRQFDANDWMRLVQTEKVDRAMMVPTMLKQLMDGPDFRKYDLSSLKVITYGAAPMPLIVIEQAIREFPNTRFINAFGQTESAATITMLGPEDHVIDGTPKEREIKLKRLGSIGKPLPDVEVRVLDEDGNESPRGVVGEIVARGGRVMKGYWKQEDATAAAIDKKGYLHTGDLGYQDDGGYIFLAGRAKDIIKRGGEMISPEEIENVLLTHPCVEDVAIIGVSDTVWGERVRAIIVPKAGQTIDPNELMELCRQKLASFKKPESVVLTDEIPRNQLGKILKRVLREKYSEPIVDAVPPR
ncbi:MAG: Long-chain-fatty-acid--CoA ligase FadD13 [Dehalococcoidia bacterium]|nr:Long-chain-fatty-acid--CoA ligase FadD13 [Dehalococcoidia bacterium]